MKKLSIIIPLYNTAKDLLIECLESCKDNEDVEVIVIDDGSTINYKEIINNYNVRYIKIPNGGVSVARNLGLTCATGEYITLLDSDDKMANINKILANLQKHNIIITRNYLLKPEGQIENRYDYNETRTIPSEDLKRNMLVLEGRKADCIEPVWAKFYKRDFLRKNRLSFNEKVRRGEDVLFNYEAFSREPEVLYLNEFSYIYRMDNPSVTRTFDKIMDTNTYKLLEEFESLFDKLNIDDPNYPTYVFRLIVRLMRKYFVHLTLEEFNQKIDLLFNNVIINYYLIFTDPSKLDKYKQKLHRLILEKDKINLYKYLRDVCDKKLLKK